MPSDKPRRPAKVRFRDEVRGQLAAIESILNDIRRKLEEIEVTQANLEQAAEHTASGLRFQQAQSQQPRLRAARPGLPGSG